MSGPQTTPREPITHDQKCWPPYFDAVANGAKPFEVRKADRDYRVGDVLVLREFIPETSTFTGLAVKRWVTYRLDGGAFGVEAGTCILGLGR